MEPLKIANDYGNVDLTTTTLGKRYTHVPGKRLQPLCRKLGVKYANAMIGWSGSNQHGWKPETDGVIVSTRSAMRLRNEIRKREHRNPPDKRSKAKKRREKARSKQEKDRRQRLSEAGIARPNSATAAWYEQGDCEEHEAQLIQFKAYFRHQHTDYEQLLDKFMDEARHNCDGSDYETRQFYFSLARQEAREDRREEEIPDTWSDYLGTYDFPHPEVAKALAAVLMNPCNAHPIWFCEAVIAVKRKGLSLDGLDYESIADALDSWRSERT